LNLILSTVVLKFLQNMTVVNLEKQDQENGFVINHQRRVDNNFQ
jgi:hypothetical protein